jgi:glutamate synthase (NADPH) large chain
MTGGHVIILGATGRNFAAGMSGGIAYIYDVLHQFDKLCNKEMVDIDPLSDDDAVFLQTMIAKHVAKTKSTVGHFVLSDFENQLKNFVKVFPKDYKKVLAGKKEKVQVEK